MPRIYERLDDLVSRQLEKIADRVGRRAKSIDPDADIRIEQITESVDGLNRTGWAVVNAADTAADHEFGWPNQVPLRPLGRAADEVRDRG